VHRGETLAQIYEFLTNYTIPIRKRVFGDAPMGLELRLGVESARELSNRAARRRFREFLLESKLVLFSVNAYPILDFHADRVKEAVYEPSWRDRARSTCTARIARVAADLAPEGMPISISTLGGAYRRTGHDDKTFRRLAAGYLRALEAFYELEKQGARLILAVEPEPETTFETAADVISFVEDWLLPLAFEKWPKLGLRSKPAIEEVVRRLFTVNFDTCHLSVLFEDPVANLDALDRAGIRIGKIHVTNAIGVRGPYRSPRAYDALRAMDEPRYFHQFAGADRSGKVIWRDVDLDRLPERLERGRHPDVDEIRSHFHVPLYLARHGLLHTTQDETVAALRAVVAARWTEHLVLETYTWPILAGSDRVGSVRVGEGPAGAGAADGERRSKLIAGISREHEWLLGELEKVGIERHVVAAGAEADWRRLRDVPGR
jgi:hypothetical protein